MNLNSSIFIKCLILGFIICFNISYSYAAMKDGVYPLGHIKSDQGNVYSNCAFPTSVSTALNNTNDNYNNLKKGTSYARNYVKFVEIGDAGINTAMKRGKLNKVSFVATKIHKVNVPISVIVPIYYKGTTTIVYGNRKDEQ